MKKKRIYTCSGDKGRTSLGTGKRVPKSHLRIQALGEIDEANAALGVASLYVSAEIQELLTTLQNDLFDIGADLCFPEIDETQTSSRIDNTYVNSLEKQIDAFDAALPPLDTFILPGGSKASAYLHQARAVVRRAERTVTALKETSAINPLVLIYLNRLSDLLFVLVRTCNDLGKNDVKWVFGLRRKDI